MNNRVAWVDATRGIGIILVVFGHVWRGVNEAGLIPNTGVFEAVDAAIYVFHMPLFFLVSGLFFEKSVLRDGVLPSLWRRIEALLYPLLLWSWITAAFLIVAGSLTNRPPISAMDALLYPFPPKDIFWFLWALFVIQTLASFFAKAPTVLLTALFAISLAVLLALGMEPFPYLLKRVVENLPFFMLGVLLARSGRFPLALGRWTGPTALVAFAACLTWAVANPDLIDTWSAYLVGLAATLTFCVAVAWLCTITPERLTAPVASLGVASIAIYVSHVMPLAAARIVLLKIGLTSLPLHLIVGTIAGVLPAAVAYWLLRRWGYLRWFGLGKDKGPSNRTVVADVSPARPIVID